MAHSPTPTELATRSAVPTTTRNPVIAALRLIALWILVGVTLGQAVAFGPRDALLRREGPRVRDAHESVQSAEDALAGALAGVSAGFAVVPSLTYGADVEDPAELGVAIALDLDVGYVYDSVAILDERLDLEKARAALQDAYRWEGKQALELYGALLRAHLSHDATLAAAVAARSALAAAVAGGDAFEIAYAELDLRDAELAGARRSAELRELQRDTAALGLVGAPIFEATLFALPQVDAADTPRHRILVLGHRTAAARGDRLRTSGVMQSIELATRYESRTDLYQLDASLGLDRGRPALAFGAEYGSQQDDQWMIGLSARIAVDERSRGELDAAERSAMSALRELNAHAASFGDRAAVALLAAEHAQAQLGIALDTWRTRQREVADVRARNADTARVERNLARDLDRTYLAWLRYVEEVDDYLELVGADWDVVGRLR